MKNYARAAYNLLNYEIATCIQVTALWLVCEVLN